MELGYIIRNVLENEKCLNEERDKGIKQALCLQAAKKTDWRIGSLLIQQFGFQRSWVIEALSKQLEVDVVDLHDFKNEIMGFASLMQKFGSIYLLNHPFLIIQRVENTFIICLKDKPDDNLTSEIKNSLQGITSINKLELETVVGLQLDFQHYFEQIINKVKTGKQLVTTDGSKQLEVSCAYDLLKNTGRQIEGNQSDQATPVPEQAGAAENGSEDDRDKVEETEAEAVQEVSIEDVVVKLVNSLILKAIKQRTSDIHFEPTEDCLLVRFRVDGALYTELNLPKDKLKRIISRLKILARMNIAEHETAQDGRFFIQIKSGGKKIDFRVSCVPTVYGERVVLRILDPESLKLDLEQLGLIPEQLSVLEEAIHLSNGIVLVTGPTGSGKTTTLYSCLANVRSEEKNILTIENPVEYRLAGISQQEINDARGRSFASVLRSNLRQDPDVIMVGEIRDYETAEVAIQAALTGHLVLSTIHTNDAAATITRLINMGIEPFLVSTAVRLIIAQRLVRKICPQCKEAVKAEAATLLQIGFKPEEAADLILYRGRGCDHCLQRGYFGRMAIYELLSFTPEIKEMILKGEPGEEIRDIAVNALSMITLRRAGLELVKKGVTTIAEVVGITQI